MDSLRNPESDATPGERGRYCSKRRTEHESDHSFEAVAIAHDGDGRHYGHNRDMVEQLTGVTRIDIEIR